MKLRCRPNGALGKTTFPRGIPGPHTWVLSHSLHFTSGKLHGQWRRPNADREATDPATPLDISKPAAFDNPPKKGSGEEPSTKARNSYAVCRPDTGERERSMNPLPRKLVQRHLHLVSRDFLLHGQRVPIRFSLFTRDWTRFVVKSCVNFRTSSYRAEIRLLTF